MKILKINEVIQKTGLSRVTIWRRETSGDFPVRIQITPGRVGWLEDEVDEWIEARPRLGNPPSGREEGGV